MILAILLMRLFEVVFFVGIAGSAVVVALSFIEDLHELFGD
jgi:hypothetical protein